MLNENCEEVKIYCPLLKKDISEGYCYEINSARLRHVESSILDDVISQDDMENCCVNCKYCLYEFLLESAKIN